MRAYVAIPALFVAFVAGIIVVYNSPRFSTVGNSQPTTGSLRDPAAIKRVFDFSNLAGNALSTASKQRLLSGARIVRDSGDVGIELGHFVVMGPDGKRTFACQRYNKVTLVFEGDGFAIAGEKPQMEVEGKCEISADINAIAPLWIPVAKILGEPVADGEFDFREGKAVTLKFANVSQQWPKVWSLKSVRLFDSSNEGNAVDIAPEDLKDIISKPFILEFPQ